METKRSHLVLKGIALLLAVSLSGVYIYSEWQGQPTATDEADTPDTSNMSKTPNLDMNRAMPKSSPLEYNIGNFKPDPPEDGPPPTKPKQAPGFDLNEALSKTGTIKADKVFAPEDGGGKGGLFGGDPDDKEEKEKE